MFPFTFLAAVILLSLGLSLGGAQGLPFVAAGVLSGAVVFAVIVKWITTPEGVKDFLQGGVVGFKDTPYRLTWFDWAILFGRSGSIDKNSGVLRIDRRFLCGLIPFSRVERPVSDFYRVEFEADDSIHEREARDWTATDRFRTERRRGLRAPQKFLYEASKRTNPEYDRHLDHHTDITRVDYSVRLVDRRAHRVLVFDLSVVGAGTDRARNMVADFRERLEEVVGIPGSPQAMSREANPIIYNEEAERQEPQDEGLSDFDAWRQARGE